VPETIPFFGVAEPVSALTHLAGAIVFLVLGIELIQRGHGNTTRQRALRVYVAGVVFALTASGLLHVMAPGTPARVVMAGIDHAGIFLLIASTYTPVHIIEFRGWMRYGVLIPVWSAAAIGIMLKSTYSMPEWVSLSLYLGLGWTGLVSATALYRAVGLAPLWPLILGALAYTGGALLDFADQPVVIAGILGPHEIFHLLVLLGVGSHWAYIRKITIYAPVTDLYGVRR